MKFPSIHTHALVLQICQGRRMKSLNIIDEMIKLLDVVLLPANFYSGSCLASSCNV